MTRLQSCVFVVASVVSAGMASAQQTADLILHNGKIAVVDPAFSIHQAIVVKGGKVVAVGGNDLAKTYRAERTIDLGGRLVIPGFNDTHIHLSGQARRHVNLAGTKSIKQIQQLLHAKAKEVGPGEWVTGSAWSEDELEDKRRPLRRDLDEAAPENPVIITRAGGHSAVANSLALKLAGVTKDTPQPDGGVIEKDERGELNGVIRERQGIVSRLVPTATAAELRTSLIQNIRNVLSLGITSFTLAGTSPAGYAEWEEIYRAHGDSLPRATVQIRWMTPEGRNEQSMAWGGAEKMKAFGRKTGSGTDRLKVGAVKVSVDGGFTGPAAYTLQPYKGQATYRGYLNFTEAQIYDIVKTGHDLGWQMGFHAIGDGAIKLTVDVFERVLRESPRADHRHYLNHFTIPPPVDTMKKMAANRILITQQPNFTYTLEGRYAENLDGYRLEHNNPVATPWKKHGIFMAFSADVLPIGPLVGIYAAVTRKGMSGKVWGADERVTVQDAIRAYTINSAFINFDEAIKGTLEPGKLADMVVLAEDLLTMDANRLKDARVDMTIVSGKVLYERGASSTTATNETPRQAPVFRVDPMWPKPLPNHWIVGAVVGVAVDSRDHVWVTHRPSTLQPNETRSIWRAAPPVLEFDQDGTLVSSWGGPGPGYEWPQLEHGIHVDHQDNVWVGGGGEKDAHILKFTRDGKFLLQIGRQGKGGGSNDTHNLGAAAHMVVDPATNELFVADGYVNHRVIVFDAGTGEYKRHWGAYGKTPDDGYFTRAGERLPGPFSGAVQHENKPSQFDPKGPPPPQFRIVHAVRISRDGLVYVCDRTNNRIQVFRKDGTFVQEAFVAKNTFGSGAVWDIGFSVDPEQTFLFVPDGTNQFVYVLDRKSLQVVSTFGGAGRWAGQFYGAHNLAVNSKGDLFITETYEGKRVQKFRLQ